MGCGLTSAQLDPGLTVWSEGEEGMITGGGTNSLEESARDRTSSHSPFVDPNTEQDKNPSAELELSSRIYTGRGVAARQPRLADAAAAGRWTRPRSAASSISSRLAAVKFSIGKIVYWVRKQH